jgi:hypothetical protein
LRKNIEEARHALEKLNKKIVALQKKLDGYKDVAKAPPGTGFGKPKKALPKITNRNYPPATELRTRFAELEMQKCEEETILETHKYWPVEVRCPVITVVVPASTHLGVDFFSYRY